MDRINSKRELRKIMKARRREVPLEERNAYSAALCELLLEREDVQCAIGAKGVFAVYLASKEEIDLSLLIERLWTANCRVVVPAWRDDIYRLIAYSPKTKLVAGPMGILEPALEGDGLKSVAEGDVAVWIVPGLAFSRSGARLGYGGGWYDRFLAKSDPSSISLGVAYPFQIVDDLPLEPHDLPLSDSVSIG
ncbi:MAG: 5-formyltetrahydrofolate cyclo-ligase [Kiritimatiellae bacterium]|nr:5-formyltetrahydrofolate cyclo-ligase [Kiritimatiellia bacterium]